MMNTKPLILRNCFFCLVLLLGFISNSYTNAAAQTKGTCLINNKVTYDCDLSKFTDTCLYNGQILPCNKTPDAQSACGNLPPIPAELKKLLADLVKTKSYKERSEIYDAIHKELQKRGIGAGFFEAASVTTNNIHWSLDLDKNTQEFLDSLSQELAVMNAQLAVELLQTGKLANESNSATFSYPSQIDREMVRREQAYAEKKLSSQTNRSEIVAAMNKEMNGTMDSLLGQGFDKLGMYSSLNAARLIREQKRKSRRDPNAQFDYGDMRDRVGVGDILSGKFRDENLPNGILCR